MEARNNNDDTKIVAALACLFAGFFFVWNIAAHVSSVYELRLDAETCERVKIHGLAPSAECVVAAPFRPAVMGPPAGYLTLPDGSDIQIAPLAARQTNESVAWSAAMKTQLVMALLFWAATLALLLSAFRGKK